jgi:hypothetical protein
MKRHGASKKLTLNKETMRFLSSDTLEKVQGGELTEAGTCGCPIRTQVGCNPK